MSRLGWLLIPIVGLLVIGLMGCDFRQLYSDARPTETIWDHEISCSNYCTLSDVVSGPDGDVYLVVPFYGDLRVGVATFDPAVCRPQDDDSDQEWGIALLRFSSADGSIVWSRMLCEDGGAEILDPVLGFAASGDLLVAGNEISSDGNDFVVQWFAADDGTPGQTHAYTPSECPLVLSGDSSFKEPRLLATDDGFAMLRCGQVGFYDDGGDLIQSHDIFTTGDGAATDFALTATDVLVAGQFRGSTSVGGDPLPNVYAQFAASYGQGDFAHQWSMRVPDSLEWGDGPRLVADPDGNLLTAGMSNRPERELLVTQIETAGVVGWARRFGGSSPIGADDAAVRSNGIFTVVGGFEGEADFDGQVLAFGDDIIRPFGTFVVDLDPADGSVLRASLLGGGSQARTAAGPDGVLFVVTVGDDFGRIAALGP